MLLSLRRNNKKKGGDFIPLFSVTCFRNEWGPPDRKVDTRKYRAEPKSIFEYEPGKSSILEHERPVSMVQIRSVKVFKKLHICLFKKICSYKSIYLSD